MKVRFTLTQWIPLSLEPKEVSRLLVLHANGRVLTFRFIPPSHGLFAFALTLMCTDSKCQSSLRGVDHGFPSPALPRLCLLLTPLERTVLFNLEMTKWPKRGSRYR